MSEAVEFQLVDTPNGFIVQCMSEGITFTIPIEAFSDEFSGSLIHVPLGQGAMDTQRSNQFIAFDQRVSVEGILLREENISASPVGNMHAVINDQVMAAGQVNQAWEENNEGQNNLLHQNEQLEVSLYSPPSPAEASTIAEPSDGYENTGSVSSSDSQMSVEETLESPPVGSTTTVAVRGGRRARKPLTVAQREHNKKRLVKYRQQKKTLEAQLKDQVSQLNKTVETLTETLAKTEVDKEIWSRIEELLQNEVRELRGEIGRLRAEISQLRNRLSELGREQCLICSLGCQCDRHPPV